VSWGISGDVGDDLLSILAKQEAMRQQRQMAMQEQQQFAVDQQDRERRMQFEDEDRASSRELKRIQIEDIMRRRDADDAAKRESRNEKGTRRMIGDVLMQRQGPLSADDRRGIAALQVESGDMPDPRLLQEPEDPQAARQREREDYEWKKQTDAKYQRPAGSGGGAADQVWVVRDGVPMPIAKGTARPGDRPYDIVGDRQSKPTDNAEAMDTAREVQRIADQLLKHPGLGSAFGSLDSRLPTIRQSTADAEVLRDSLTSLLTLENTGKLKGVLSNADMEILRRASSTIAPQMGDEAARAELQRLIEVMGRVTAGGAPAPAAAPASAPSGGGVVEYVRDPRTGKLVRKQ
jgi:hypothetical protein